MKSSVFAICLFSGTIIFGQNLLKKEDLEEKHPFSWYSSIAEDSSLAKALPEPSIAQLLATIPDNKKEDVQYTMPVYEAPNTDTEMKTEVPKELPKQFLKFYGKKE